MNVYKVIRKDDGSFSCISGVAEIRGSWWVITRRDGSVEKVNGGGPWKSIVPDAWKIMGVSIAMMHLREHSSVAIANTARPFLDDMWEEAFEYGRLVGNMEQDRRTQHQLKEQDDARTKH